MPRVQVCAHSLLHPGKAAGLPAVGLAAMAFAIDVPLEAAGDVVAAVIAGGCDRNRSRARTCAAAADEIDRRRFVGHELLDPRHELAVDLHLGIELPADEAGLL